MKPVRDGHRVCLIYNLVLAGAKHQPRAPQPAGHVDAVKDFLCSHFSNFCRAVIPLTHEYTEAGLSREALKGQDRSILEVIGRAAEQLEMETYLGLLTITQSGEADCDYDSMYYHHRGRFSDDCVEIGESYEESLTVDHWLDIDDYLVELGPMSFEQEEVLAQEPLDDLPFEQEVHEASGNEGVSVERWYHGAALVLWPKAELLPL